MKIFEHGAPRAFMVALLVALTTPPLFFWLGTILPGRDANFMTLGLPLLSGAFPLTLVAQIPRWQGGVLSVLQMAFLAALLARHSRGFPLGEQVLVSYVMLAVLAIVGGMLLAIFGISVWSSPTGWG